MSPNPQQTSLFTHIDVSPQSTASEAPRELCGDDTVILLKRLLVSQQRQTALLEEMVQHMSSAQRQRASELGQWKEANPFLARRCREAAEALGQVQTEFLRTLTEEITSNAEDYMDGEFLLNEFVDRYGPRLAHLNGVLQVLSQLSSIPAALNS